MRLICKQTQANQYHSEDDANHLTNTLKKYYPIRLDREGKNYCGLTMHWHYNEGYVDIEMPNYVTKKLKTYKTNHHQNHNMSHLSGIDRPTANKHNVHLDLANLSFLIQNKLNWSNPSSVHSCIMLEPWILQYCQHLTKYPHSNLNQLKKLLKNANAFGLYGDLSLCTDEICCRYHATNG